MNALSTLSQMPETKAEIKSFVEKAKSEILGGIYNPLEVHVRLKVMEDTIDAIRKDHEVKAAAFREAAKYGNLPFNLFGASITLANLGTKYDFSTCNDSEWNNLNEQAKQIAELKKERETFLKSIPSSGTVNPETGELITAPIKTFEEGIKITLK